MKELIGVKLFILAILLRILIMPLFFHPDIKTTHYKVSFLRQGIINVYPYIVENKAALIYPEEFNYFPLTHLSLGGYQLLASPLLGQGFDRWLTDGSSTANLQVGVFRYLFLLKLPYLLFDIAVAFLIAQFFQDSQKRRKAVLLWLFNPISLALIYIYANFDIIPTFLLIGSLLLAKKQKPVLSALTIGVASAFKAFPMLLLPFLLLTCKNRKQVVLSILAAVGSFALIIAPFWSKAFMDSALVSGLTTRMFESGISLGFGESVMPVFLSLSVLFFHLWSKKREVVADNLWQYYLIAFLLIFSFIHFHIQWLIWILPVLVILVIKKPQLIKETVLVALLYLVIPLLYDDKFMTFSLLQPVSLVFDQIPTLFGMVSKVYDPFALQSVLHSMLAGGSIYLSWKILKEE